MCNSEFHTHKLVNFLIGSNWIRLRKQFAGEGSTWNILPRTPHKISFHSPFPLCRWRLEFALEELSNKEQEQVETIKTVNRSDSSSGRCGGIPRNGKCLLLGSSAWYCCVSTTTYLCSSSTYLRVLLHTICLSHFAWKLK